MRLLQFIFLGLQQTAEQIKDKMDTAPDKSYEIGVVIGTYLPFVLFIALAYFIYYKAKNRKD